MICTHFQPNLRKEFAIMQKFQNVENVATCILSVGGCIFGGYVRDKIYMDLKKEALGKMADNMVLLDNEMPGDIDCIVSMDNITRLVKAFEAAGYVSKKLTSATDSYIDDTRTDYSLLRFRVSPKVPDVVADLLDGSFDVHVDVISSNVELEPPFSEIDFECNALIMGPSGDVRLSSWLFKDPVTLRSKALRLLKIYNDIQMRAAVQINHVPERVAKMAGKGWKIKENEKVVVKSFEPHTCTLCLDDGSMVFHNKRKCCNARYHFKCYDKMLENVSCCPNCRNVF